MLYFKKYYLVVSFLTTTTVGFAQIFGGNPASTKWKQINTPVARIIFPKSLDSTAQRVMSIVTFMDSSMLKTIGNKQKKVNVVLQNQTTISNAYVGLGPFRSEFLTTPLQNSFELGSLPWPDQLTIHEFRHVQQYNNFRVGLSKLMYNVFGEEGQALANNASIPNWFYEGDAVYNETNVSKQGRGSLPFFYNGYRSLWKDGKHYSWMKLRNGSFKDFVPDHYNLGFLLTAYGREKYGDHFWAKVTHDAASFKGLFYPFQRAIKKYSGKNYKTFRNDAFAFFREQLGLNVSPGIETKHEAYSDEQFPVYAGDDTIIYIKSSYHQVPEFVVRTQGKDYRLRIRDNSIDNQFSYGNDKIVYSSYQPDARWGYRDYSNICILDVTNGKEYTLTKRSKYFSPDISSDGKQVIAVDETTGIKCYLHVIDASSGKVIRAVPNPHNLFYTYPKFYHDSEIISAVRDTIGKMSLALIDINTGAANYLTPFSYNIIGFPYIKDDTVYFSYSYQKNDELFAYTFSDKKLWKVSSGQQHSIGKYQPSVNAKNIIWSAFTSAGYRLEEVLKRDVNFQELKPEYLDKNTSSFGLTSLQKTNSNLLYSVPKDSFAISKYSKAFNLFNFHSLEPMVDDPQYSLALLGENVLNTFQSQLTLTYDRAEKFKKVGFSATYGAWFPFLSAGINYTFDRHSLYHGKEISFNELEPYAGFRIPLNLSKGRSFTYLDFGSQYVYNQSNYTGVYKDSLGTRYFDYNSSFISFSHQLQKALQEIFPKFAQTLDLSYKVPVSKYKGFQFVANGSFYFPGFLKNHSIILNGAYLRKDTVGQISFSSGFPFSRGYSSVNLYQMHKWGVDYQLPLLYPDAGFANIFYLLRVRSDLFYDNTDAHDFYSNGNKFSATFRSTGIEVYIDSKWWNEAYISIGLRYSRLLDDDVFGGTGRNRWEVILPVNIFNQ